jgi:hypothetical protein
MTTSARPHSSSGETSVRRGAAFRMCGAIRDLASDWRHWSLAERAAVVALVVLLVLAILTVVAALSTRRTSP